MLLAATDTYVKVVIAQWVERSGAEALPFCPFCKAAAMTDSDMFYFSNYFISKPLLQQNIILKTSHLDFPSCEKILLKENFVKDYLQIVAVYKSWEGGFFLINLHEKYSRNNGS